MGLPTENAVYSFVTGFGYQTEHDVQEAISIAVASMYVYKGSVQTENDLPKSNITIGDVYNIVEESSYGPPGMNVAWTGEVWDALGSSISIEAMSEADVRNICV